MYWVATESQAYLRRAETTAQEIGILPADFWELTPHEFAGLVAGARKREEREWERAAWQLSHLYGLLRRKKPPSVDRLLGRETRNRIAPPRE